MHMGKKIRHYRLKKPARQEEMAEFLGVTAQAISKWETDASFPDITLLPRIAIFLGVTIDELFRLSDDEQFERIENALFAGRSVDDETFRHYVSFLERRVAEAPGSTRARTDLAALYNHRAYSDHMRADAYAREALSIDPDDSSTWSALLEANSAPCGDDWLDNHFTIIEYCKAYLKEHPGNSNALYAPIESLLIDDRFDEAKPYIEQMRRIPGRAYQCEAYLGDICFGRGEREQALAHWNAAADKNPDIWQAYCDRADGYRKLGLYDEALADYEKCFSMQTPPRLVDGLHARAQLFEQIGKYDEAIAERRRIIETIRTEWNAAPGDAAAGQARDIARLEKCKALAKATT